MGESKCCSIIDEIKYQDYLGLLKTLQLNFHYGSVKKKLHSSGQLYLYKIKFVVSKFF
jgi:hypothetical protein